MTTKLVFLLQEGGKSKKSVEIFQLENAIYFSTLGTKRPKCHAARFKCENGPNDRKKDLSGLFLLKKEKRINFIFTKFQSQKKKSGQKLEED